MKRVTLLLLSIYVAIADAAPTVTARGTGGDNSSSASTTVTPTGTIPVGSMGVLLFTGDNANGTAANFPTSITDSVGNIWYKRGYQHPTGGAANATVETGLYVAQITVAFTTSNSLTLTYTAVNVTAKSWVLWQATPGTGGNIMVVDNTSNNQTFANLSANQFTASGTPSLATTTTVATDNVIVGMVGAESADTFVADSDTTNGSWSTAQSTGFGSGGTGNSIISQYKVVTAGGAQTYNPTLTSADGSIQFVQLSENSPFGRGSFGNNSSAAGLTVSPGAPMAVGTMGVICIAVDNSGLNGDTATLPAGPLTDSVGNTWTLRTTGIYDPGAAAAGVEVGIYTAPIATLFTPIDNLGFTFGVAVIGKSVAWWCVAAAASGTLDFSAGATGTGSATASPTITTSSITSGDIVLGIGGAEGANTWVADGDSTNGAWSIMQSNGSSAGGTTSMAVTSQYKITTGTATQTYNPTLTSADVILGWVSIHETVTAGNTTGFFLLVP